MKTMYLYTVHVCSNVGVHCAVIVPVYNDYKSSCIDPCSGGDS